MWRTIDNYPKYEVSDQGEVRVIKTGKVLKPSVDLRGYYKVTLINEAERKTLFVHRLVAAAFIDNPNNYDQVNHIDENKQNNSINNLEWCDIKYNCNYGTRNQRISSANKGKEFSQEHKNKLSEKQAGENNSMYGKIYDQSPHAKSIVCIETQVQYLSERAAAEELGLSQTSLSNCLSGRSKTAGGFHWEYA